MNNLTVATVGLQSRDHTLLTTAIDMAAGLEIGHWTIVDELDQAQVIIVNSECPDSLAASLAALNETIILVEYTDLEESQTETEFQLQPPLAYKTVTRLLKQLETQINQLARQKPSNATRAVTPAEPTSKTSPSDPVENSLSDSQPKLDEALNSSPAEIQASSDENLTTEPVTEPVDESTDNEQKLNAFKPGSHIEEIDPVDIIKQKIDWLSDEEQDASEPKAQIVEASDKANHPIDGPILTNVVPVEELEPELNEGDSGTDNLSDNYPEDSEDGLSTNFSNDVATKDFFAAETRLIGMILSILEQGQTAKIQHALYPELKIYSDNAWFVFADELDSHPALFREDTKDFQIEILDDEIKDELHDGNLPQSLWKLLFTAALFGSEGRLFSQLDYQKAYHLLHTPYFGMIPHTSDHITIAEFMVHNHATLETISHETQVEMETVIDFCNACESIQLLQTGEDESSINAALHTRQLDVSILENEITLESTVNRQDDIEKKSGLINSLWSNLTKTN